MSGPTNPLRGLGSAAADRAFFGHPKGLSTLFFTEMWERFSYYGMRAFLVLYVVAAASEGGLGMREADAGIIYGLYGSMVYLLSLPGGWIADRFLGHRKAILVGGILIMLGHITLAIPAMATFYVGLLLVTLGTGLLKPNVSTVVGQLYDREDSRRDAGYTIFYMGINIGAFVAPLVCGWLAQSDTFRAMLSGWGIDPRASWHFGFGAAAIGMFFGLVQYVRGWKYLGTAGLHPTIPSDPVKAAQGRKILVAVLLAVFGIPILVGVLAATGTFTFTKSQLADVFGVGLTLMAVFVFVGMWSKAENADERRRVIAMIVLFVGCFSFFALFEQAGSTLNLFAENHTRNELLGFEFPASWFQSVNPLYIVLGLAPLFAWLWIRLARSGREPSSVLKFAIGMVLTAMSFAVMLPAMGQVEAGQRISPSFLLTLYFFSTAAEMCISPVGLSSMSKLAPARLGGMVMGVWFLATAIGYYLAGRAAEYTEAHGPRQLFWLLIVFSLVIAALLFAVSRPIQRMLAKRPDEA